MQDNVISHIAKSTLDALDEVFGEWVVNWGLASAVTWFKSLCA
jgi:hypothetical protein